MTCNTSYGKGIVLVGALSMTQTTELEQGNIKVGVWLKPGSRYLFSSYEPAELQDTVVPGRAMGQKVREFETAINRIDTPQEKLECLQDFIEQLIHEKEVVRHAVVDSFINAAITASGQATVAEIMQGLPISYRQCLRLIKHYTGFTAKEFLKLQRFNIAAHDLGASEQSISVVAAYHNYADHPHFTREFRSRVGVVPSAFGNHQAL